VTTPRKPLGPLADIPDLHLVDGLYEFLRDTHVID
jgi:hypothetical protein